MDKTIAERLFREDYEDDEGGETPGIAEDAKVAHEELLCLLKAADIPFDRIGYDWYDRSLELYDVPPDYRLDDTAHAAIASCDFAKVFVNHTDKWETHYNFRPLAKRYGWRIRHKHKSGLDKTQLEEWPEGWTGRVDQRDYEVVTPAVVANANLHDAPENPIVNQPPAQRKENEKGKE